MSGSVNRSIQFGAGVLKTYLRESELEPISFSGVNNAFILRATLKTGSSSSRFEYYNFTKEAVINLKSIAIKIIFLTGSNLEGPQGKTPYLNAYIGKKPKLQDQRMIESEVLKQNEIYTKSLQAFGAPICPPCIGVEFVKGRDKTLLSIMMNNLKKPESETEKLRRDAAFTNLSRMAADKSRINIGFIVMGELNKNFYNYQDYLGRPSLRPPVPPLLKKINVEFDLKQTFPYIVAEAFKLRLLQYAHNDLHAENVLLANPFIIDKPSSSSTLYQYLDSHRDERIAIAETLNLDVAILASHTKMDTPTCVLIDFGGAQPKKCNEIQKIVEKKLGEIDYVSQIKKASGNSNTNFEGIMNDEFVHKNKGFLNAEVAAILSKEIDTWNIKFLQMLFSEFDGARSERAASSGPAPAGAGAGEETSSIVVNNKGNSNSVPESCRKLYESDQAFESATEEIKKLEASLAKAKPEGKNGLLRKIEAEKAKMEKAAEYLATKAGGGSRMRKTRKHKRHFSNKKRSLRRESNSLKS